MMTNPNALARSGPITPARLMFRAGWWMKPRLLGEVTYDTQLDADLAQARDEVTFFAKMARDTIFNIRRRRASFDAGHYSRASMMSVDAMFDGFNEDLHFYLGRRRKWLSQQLSLERERLARPHDMAAE